jgi:hypothetical protein
MVSVSHEINFANLNKVDGRQAKILKAGRSNIDPTIPIIILHRVEITIEIRVSAFTPFDAMDTNRLCAQMMLADDNRSWVSSSNSIKRWERPCKMDLN